MNIIISKSELKLLKVVADTGMFFEVYLDKINMSKSVLSSCMRKDFIQKTKPVFVLSELLMPYVFTETFSDLVSSIIHKIPYRTNINHAEHDYMLGNVYLSLNDSERDSWKTESELLREYPNQIVIDGLYYNSDGKKIGVEILTNNYTKKDIKAKENFIKKHCDSKIVINSKDIK